MLQRLCASFLIVMLLVATGCARKTMIFSEPTGAQVFVNGKDVCVTPCAFAYRTGSSGKTYQVVLDKVGYEPVAYELQANEVDEEARASLWSAGLIIPGGSLLWIGSLFTNKLEESYRFVLSEEVPIIASHAPYFTE